MSTAPQDAIRFRRPPRHRRARRDLRRAHARRAILDELNDRDGQTLFELCTRLTMNHGLGLSRQAISQHLEVLESAGLVHSKREGRYKFHHLDHPTPLKAIGERWSNDDRNGG